MYFDRERCAEISGWWLGAVVEPWLGGLILGIQGNYRDEPDPPFSYLKDVWSWEITSVFDLVLKPTILLIVLGLSLVGIGLKLLILLVLLLPWLLIAVLSSIRLGLPAYEQTWIEPRE